MKHNPSERLAKECKVTDLFITRRTNIEELQFYLAIGDIIKTKNNQGFTVYGLYLGNEKVACYSLSFPHKNNKMLGLF